jgi:hypothetical protein
MTRILEMVARVKNSLMDKDNIYKQLINNLDK